MVIGMGTSTLTALIYGLSALALAGFGIWILKRETPEVIRAIGYLFIGVGIFISTGALVRILIGLMDMFGLAI